MTGQRERERERNIVNNQSRYFFVQRASEKIIHSLIHLFRKQIQKRYDNDGGNMSDYNKDDNDDIMVIKAIAIVIIVGQ